MSRIGGTSSTPSSPGATTSTRKGRANPSAKFRFSWPSRTIDLKFARIAVAKVPNKPTLEGRMERFLAECSQGTAEEASKALNELAMMVSAAAVDRRIPAAEILTPIAAKIVGRWSNDQVSRERLNLLQHRDSLAGGKTRVGIVNMILALYDEELRFHAELDQHLKTLTAHLKDEEVGLYAMEELINRHSEAFVDAFDREGKAWLTDALISYFKRTLPELNMGVAKLVLHRVGTAGKSIASEVPNYPRYEGGDWVKKRAAILVCLHDAFHRAQGRKPPALTAILGYGNACVNFLDDYSQRSAARLELDDVKGKGKEHDL
jgi:hypothetical protein